MLKPNLHNQICVNSTIEQLTTKLKPTRQLNKPNVPTASNYNSSKNTTHLKNEHNKKAGKYGNYSLVNSTQLKLCNQLARLETLKKTDTTKKKKKELQKTLTSQTMAGVLKRLNEKGIHHGDVRRRLILRRFLLQDGAVPVSLKRCLMRGIHIPWNTGRMQNQAEAVDRDKDMVT